MSGMWMEIGGAHRPDLANTGHNLLKTVQASFTGHRSRRRSTICTSTSICFPALPPTSRATALRRQCVANPHSFTVQTHSTAITWSFLRGRTVGETSGCYDDAIERKLHEGRVQDLPPNRPRSTTQRPIKLFS